MYQGNWKCSKCGGTITELPFEPRSEAGLTCRDCYFKQKDADKAEAAPAEMGSASSEVDDRSVPDFDPEMVGGAGEQTDDGLGATATPVEKPKFEGDWKCSMCGGAITSLPFTPRSTENLKCIDCFKKSRG